MQLTTREKGFLDKLNLETLVIWGNKLHISLMHYPIEHEICWYLRDGMANFQLMTDAINSRDNEEKIESFIQRWGIKFEGKKYNGFDVTLGNIRKNSSCFIPFTDKYSDQFVRDLFCRDQVNYVEGEFISGKEAFSLTDRIWGPKDFEDLETLELGVRFGKEIVTRSINSFFKSIKWSVESGRILSTKYEQKVYDVCKKLMQHYQEVIGN